MSSELDATTSKDAASASRQPRGWLVFVVSFALSLAAMLAWTLATPISGAPDEPTHFIRAAAVVRGEISSVPYPSIPWQSSAKVPNYVGHTAQLPCFAFEPSVTALCQSAVSGDPNKSVVVGQTAQTNSPLFYAMVGLPSLVLSGDLALYSMRGVNALLCALMIGFTFASVSQLRRSRFAMFATFVAITPMLLFLGGSVNPNALEATAAVSLFAALVLLFTHALSSPRLLAVLGIVVLSTVLLTATRSISLLWALLALLAAFLLGERGIVSRVTRSRMVWIAAAICVLICASELLWFVRPSETAPMPPVSGVGTPPIVAFVRMLVTTFDFANGSIGLFGWIDTPAPAITIGAWTVALSATIVPAYFLTSGRARWGIILLGAAFLLTPPLSQAAVVMTSGYIWQGRYTLALLAMLLVASGVCLDRAKLPEFGLSADAARVGRGLLITLLTALAAGQVAAFVIALQRYVIGADKPLQLMITHPQWQPPLGWVTLTIILTAVVAGATLLIARKVVPNVRP